MNEGRGPREQQVGTHDGKRGRGGGRGQPEYQRPGSWRAGKTGEEAAALVADVYLLVLPG